MERRGFFAAMAGAVAATFGFVPKRESIYEFATRVAPLADPVDGHFRARIVSTPTRDGICVLARGQGATFVSNGASIEIDENGSTTLTSRSGSVLSIADGITWSRV